MHPQFWFGVIVGGFLVAVGVLAVAHERTMSELQRINKRLQKEGDD
jgi:hypothetical protein